MVAVEGLSSSLCDDQQVVVLDHNAVTPSPSPRAISKASYSITSTQQKLHYSPTGEECTSHVPGGGS